MAISMVAAYSSGETALVAVSTATSSSARPLGSPSCTTAVPKSDIGWGRVTQSAGALMVKRPWGSRQGTRPWAGIAGGVAPTEAVAPDAGGTPCPGVVPGVAPRAAVPAGAGAGGFGTGRAGVGA